MGRMGTKEGDKYDNIGYTCFRGENAQEGKPGRNPKSHNLSNSEKEV